MRGRITPHPTVESPGRWTGDDTTPSVDDYRRELGPPPSVFYLVGRVSGALVRATVAPVAVTLADGLLRLAGTNEICPCGGDEHDASLEERLHTAWWQGYHRREDEIKGGRL